MIVTTNPSLKDQSKSDTSTWRSDVFYEFGLMAWALNLFSTKHLFEELSDLKGSFFPTFFIQAILLGIPMTVVELSLSQYGQKNMHKIWDLCPIFRGVSYCYFILLFITQIELFLNLTYLLKYFTESFSSKTGCDKCDNEWNTINCFTYATNITRHLECYDKLGQAKCNALTWESSQYQFWIKKVLSLKGGFVHWTLVRYSCLVFLISYILSYKGIRLIEKNIRICLILASIEFLVLFYTSLLQYGVGAGIMQFSSWRWDKWKEARTWIITCNNMLGQVGLGMGGLRSLGSQNRFRGNSYMNAMMVILVTATVTFLYSILYFILCGNMAYHTNQNVDAIMSTKEPVLYAMIPQILFYLPNPKQVWRVIFFSKIFLICTAKLIITTYLITDVSFWIIPRLQHYKFSTIIISRYILQIACMLPVFTESGYFWFKRIIKTTYGGPGILILNVIQLSVILYIYGLRKVVDDLHFMFGFRMHIFWQTILLLIPIYLFGLWIYSLHMYYTSKELMRTSGIVIFIEWLFLYSPVIITIAYMIYYFIFKLKFNWRIIFRADEDWYLKDRTLMISRRMFTASSMTKEYLYRQQKRKEAEYFQEIVLHDQQQ